MTKTTIPLLAGLLLIGAPLSGCETETQTEIESDGDVDRDVEIGVDEAAVDEAQSDAQNLGDEIQEGARQVGNDIESGAAAVGEAARDLGDQIDENVDLGDNAGTPEVDDNN